MKIKLVILSAMITLFCVILNSQTYKIKGSNKVVSKNSQSVNLLSSFRETNQELEKCFAGAWIDENDIPHVAYTKKLTKEDENDAKSKGIIIELYEYTYEELIALQIDIKKRLNKPGLINSSSILQSRNAIEIGYKSDEDLEVIKEMVMSKNLNDIPILYILDTSEYISAKGIYSEYR